jgi:hypothetical protein
MSLGVAIDTMALLVFVIAAVVRGNFRIAQNADSRAANGHK